MGIVRAEKTVTESLILHEGRVCGRVLLFCAILTRLATIFAFLATI